MLDPGWDSTLSGIAQGFDIVSNLSERSPADCCNYPSATDPMWKPKLGTLFEAELAQGYMPLFSQTASHQ